MQRIGHWVNKFEETVLALLLTGMVLVSFSQVVARYVFNSGWHGALETTKLMFAWMILFGMSYGVRVSAHLGVDALARLLPPKAFRATTLFACFCCVLWAAILIDSSWLAWLLDMRDKGGAVDYVQKMQRFGLELEDLPVPRWLAYIILPLGLLLFAFRSLETAWLIWTGRRDAIISSHEAEELVEESGQIEETK